jgi:DNA-binding MarR family transcriptional regulator
MPRKIRRSRRRHIGAAHLDPVLHQRIRLGIVAHLLEVGESSFGDLIGAVDSTAGNISTHARALEIAEYVEQQKAFVDRRPQTTYRMTAKGRRAWAKYVEHIRVFLKQT